MEKCRDCRVCSPSGLDRVLILWLPLWMTWLLVCRAEPMDTRCPICGHPLKYHDRRAAV